MILNNNIYREIDERLRKFFAKSLLIHLSLLVLVILSSIIIDYTIEATRRESLQIVESSVRVDMVAMPELTIKELKSMGLPKIGHKITAEKVAQVIDKTPIKDNDFLKEKKKKNFLSMMKDIAKKKVKSKKIKKNKTKKGTLDGIARGDLKDLILQGNKLSKGTSITGSGVGASGAFSIYLGRLPMIVKPHWVLPSYLMGKELKCRIRIFVGENGKLLRANIYESSGNEEYDKKALLAVEKAAPFPKLSEQFKARGINGDIVLGFPL
jgi:colicin import membrane protein